MTLIRLKFVNRFRDRHGKWRYYFRRPGSKAVPLPGLPGSDQFMDAYQVALSSTGNALEIGSRRTKPGTVNALVVTYYQSAQFTRGLAPETQRMRRNILERLRTNHGDKRVALIQRVHVAKLLEKMTPHAQKNWLKTLRGLMLFAVAQRMRTDDPTEGLRAVTIGRSLGHMTWGEGEITRYRDHHKLGTVARVAIELLLNIAARRGDAYMLGKQHLRNGSLIWRPSKTRRSTGKLLTVPITPELQVALDAMPAKHDTLTFLTTDHGKPFASAAAFGNKFADWCVAAGFKPVQCDDGRTRSYRAHGLRKAACRRLAEAGCTAPEIMAVSGHRTLSQVQIYIDEVEQERMASNAMLKRAAAIKTETQSYKPSDPDLQTGS
jgi:integrase/recombinase XerD